MDTKSERAKRQAKVPSAPWDQPLLYGKTRARAAKQASAELLWEIDERGAYVFAGPNSAAVLGWSPEELAGRSPLDFMPSRAPARDAVSAVWASRRPFSMLERPVLRKDGRLARIESSGRPIFDAAGAFRGYRGVDRELDASRPQAPQASPSEVLLPKLYDDAPIGVALLGADGRILAANPRLRAMLGQDEPALRGSKLSDLARGPVEAGGGWWQAADGRMLWVRVTYSGRPGGARAAMVEDLTAQKRLEEDLAQARKMESVGKMASGLAHDFNNILTAILGYSESLMFRVGPGQDGRNELEEIHKAGVRAASLTHRLLNFSRKEKQASTLVDLNELVAGMGGMLSRLLGQGIEYVQAPAAVLGRVKGDAVQLEQVLMNLVINARDAMPRGGRIEVRTAPVERGGRLWARLSVADNGSGIEAAVLANIFEPFFTTKGKGRGTGLGLALVNDIVRLHGGSIEVDSVPGRGTRFDVYLPVSPFAPKP